MKKTTEQIVSAYRIINNAKLGKMEDTEKFAIIKAARQLKKVGTDFDEFLNLAQEKLKPAGFDKIAEKVQMKQELSPEESGTLEKYNQSINKCVKDELDREIELTFDPLSEEAVNHFIASNDFSVNEIIAVSDVLGS